jgi:hypothetical protein
LTTSPAPLAELALTLGGMAWRGRKTAASSPARAASGAS